MRKTVLVAPKQSRVEEHPLPLLSPNEVLIRVTACGVCASELHGWTGDGGRYPRRQGHEVVGVVEQTGQGVTSVKAGDRVTGLFGEGFADYAIAAADRVVRVPENLPDLGALGEPLSCVISAARRTRVELGDTVAVVGLGFMGLLTLQVLKLKGPAKLIAIDPRPDALAAARRFGADETLTPREVPDAYKFTHWGQLGSADGLDVAVEVSGTQAGLTLAGQLVKPHGFLSVVGWHQGGPRQVDVELWGWKALDVLNAHERRTEYQMDCMRRGLALAAAGKIDMVSLVSHKFGLDEVDDAFRALVEKPSGFTKAVVMPEPA